MLTHSVIGRLWALLTVAMLIGACAPAPAAPPAPAPATPAPAPATKSTSPAATGPSKVVAPTSSARTSISVGLATTASNSYIAEIAAEEGLFAKYGLDAKLEAFNNAPLSVQALLADNVQFITAPPLAPMQSRVQGSDAELIAIHMPEARFSLLTLPSVKAASELNGSVGISFGPGSLGQSISSVYLRKLGVDPGTVTWVASGDPAAQLTSVAQNQAKFVFLTDDWIPKAKELGLTVLQPSEELVKTAKFPFAGIFARSSYTRQHPDVAKNFLKAIGEATNVLLTNKERSIAAIRKWNPGLSPTDAELQYAGAVAGSRAAIIPRIPEAQVRDMVDLLLAAGAEQARGKTAADFANDTFVKQLEQEQFYAAYGQAGTGR